MFAAIWTAISLSLLVAGAASASACSTVTLEDTPFTVCKATPGDDIALYLNDSEGELLGSFARLVTEAEQQGRDVIFAMNGGMYHPDRSPVGLYVENGVERARLVTRKGPGNFGLLPNGVLCVTANRIAILESRAFASDPPACVYATQSGPMLVIDGALHPRFLPDSVSRFFRNGVGVTADGVFYAAISDRPVNFHLFARLFRDVLLTPNALFLDGKVSRLYAPEVNRNDIGFPLGPMLAITRAAN